MAGTFIDAMKKELVSMYSRIRRICLSNVSRGESLSENYYAALFTSEGQQQQPFQSESWSWLSMFLKPRDRFFKTTVKNYLTE